MNISAENITKIELGLINACVLKCPMCLRSESFGKNLLPRTYVHFVKLLEILDQFPNLDRIDLVGSVSEPTLYPHFIDLLCYLKRRNLKIRLSTNANTKNEKFWKLVGSLLSSEDIVRFAVDGSNQELHSIYRVGGTLQKVLFHHACFKSNSSGISILQNIIFDHNKKDKEEIKKLFIRYKFDFLEFLESGEPSDIKEFKKKNMVPRDEVCLSYINHADFVTRKKMEKLNCYAVENEQLYINHLGVMLPCDDMEELAFLDSVEKKELPNIVDNSLEECFVLINKIISRRFFNKTCLRCCSSSARNLKKQYPIIQCGKDLEFKILKKFRETICH